MCGSWDKGAGRTASAAELSRVDQSGGGRLPGPGFTTPAKQRTMRTLKSFSGSAGGLLHTWERTSGPHNCDSETIGPWRAVCPSQEGVSDTERAETQCIGSHPNIVLCTNSRATVDQ